MHSEMTSGSELKICYQGEMVMSGSQLEIIVYLSRRCYIDIALAVHGETYPLDLVTFGSYTLGSVGGQTLEYGREYLSI
jgi:hypothetical protein